jgi:hypothetical protein
MKTLIKHLGLGLIVFLLPRLLATSDVGLGEGQGNRYEQMTAMVSEMLGLPVSEHLQSQESIYRCLGLSRKWDTDRATIERYIPKKLPYGVTLEKNCQSTKWGNNLSIRVHWRPSVSEPVYGIILTLYYKGEALEDVAINRTTRYDKENNPPVGEFEDNQQGKTGQILTPNGGNSNGSR